MKTLNCTGEDSLSSYDKVVEVVKGRKYKHKVGSFYSDMFSIIERIGDYIINVSEAIKEYRDTKMVCVYIFKLANFTLKK